MVLIILAVVWAVFLIPHVLHSRAAGRPSDSIGAFNRQLRVLERATPSSSSGAGVGARRSHTLAEASAAIPVPSLAQARRRRRDVLLGLLTAMVGSLVLGLLPGLQVMLALHLALDLLFIAYVALLVRARALADERKTKVRFLPGPANSAEPAYLLRRTGN